MAFHDFLNMLLVVLASAALALSTAASGIPPADPTLLEDIPGLVPFFEIPVYYGLYASFIDETIVSMLSGNDIYGHFNGTISLATYTSSVDRDGNRIASVSYTNVVSAFQIADR